MKEYFESPLRNFLYVVALYILFALAVPLIAGKGFEVVLLSKYYNNYLHVFFEVLTSLAELPGIMAFGVIVLYFNKKKSFPFAFASLLTFVVVHFLKRIVFPDSLRPKIWASAQQIQLPGAASDLIHYSFPSGHSAFAVCMFFCLAVLFRNKTYSLVFGILAVLVSFSRVYLFAHFLIDTGIGAFVGLILGILGNYLFDLYEKRNAGTA